MKKRGKESFVKFFACNLFNDKWVKLLTVREDEDGDQRENNPAGKILINFGAGKVLKLHVISLILHIKLHCSCN